MLISSIIQSLVDQPEQTVITATRRLSRRLLYEYSQYQRSNGLSAWSMPDILPWSAWVQRQWRSLALETADSRIVLTPAQSLQLWQSIIEADSYALINAKSTAQKAQSARQLIIDYRLEWRMNLTGNGLDTMWMPHDGLIGIDNISRSWLLRTGWIQ